MKNKILKMIAMIVMSSTLLISILGFSGCDFFALVKEYEVFQDGYFEYIVMGEHSRYPRKDSPAIVAIVGFTVLGQEQESIDIPREIAGIPVRYIGYMDWTPFIEYHVYSDNLKKMYIHDNMWSIDRFGKMDAGNLGGNYGKTDILHCSMNENFYYGSCYYKNSYY